jgi:hypothetical protein
MDTLRIHREKDRPEATLVDGHRSDSLMGSQQTSTCWIGSRLFQEIRGLHSATPATSATPEFLIPYPNNRQTRTPRLHSATPVTPATPEFLAPHFPIQNSLKIFPSRSSVSSLPTTSPTASSAPRKSIEINSGGLPISRPRRPAARSSLAFCRQA